MSRRLIFAAVLLAWPFAASAQPVKDVLRDRIVVVGSTSMSGFTEAVFRQLEVTRRLKAPDLKLTGSLHGAVSFCEGIGPNYPDILAISRRMPRALYETCIDRGVLDIIEVKIGLTAVTLASRKADVQYGLTPHQVYRALAAALPDEDSGEFVPNKASRWREISPELPDVPIRFVGSPQGTAIRDFFDDTVMQGGCRSEPQVAQIFQASLRVRRCTTMRTDGVFIEVPEGGSRVAALMAAPAGTLGIISYGELVAGGTDLTAVALNGVLPTYQSIANDEYDFTRPLYFYVKRAHMAVDTRVGVVAGLREFLLDATSEQMVGPGGVLAEMGLVSLPAALRVEQRRQSQVLRRFAP